MKNYAIIFILTSLCTNISLAESFNEVECNERSMSNSAKRECLSRKLDLLNAELQNEVAMIIKHLPKSLLWGDFSDKKSEKSFYARRAEDILNADKKWKEFSTAECDMVAGVYEGGSGEDTANLSCRIKKVKERIEYLQSHEPYKSFRKNNG